MTVIPCLQDELLAQKIEEFATELRSRAHELGAHGMTEDEFFESGLFRGAIERIRGQFSATMRPKRDFIRLVLDHMQDRGKVQEWEASGDANRHDYTVRLPSGRVAVLEVKGCLDGNNTTIFERPANADEFVLWSLCTNPNADPRHNVWSGIHTRLSAEIITNRKNVDGLIVWDWLCGTASRPCPKTVGAGDRVTAVGQHLVPPPCIYLFPRLVPTPRTNPEPEPHSLASVEFLSAMHDCFLGREHEVNFVQIEVSSRGSSLYRTTTISRDGAVLKKSKPTKLRRGD